MNAQQLTLKELSLRNFLSFGNDINIINLDTKTSTLIVGNNLDSTTSNGSGKTAIINALMYAIYNKPLSDISLKHLANRTNTAKSNMEVTLTFSKGNDEYKIVRNGGKKSDIHISKNDKDVTPSSISQADKEIENIIGISANMFASSVIFSGKSIPFLSLPLSQQRSQIEELLGITLLTEKAEILKEQIKDTLRSIAVEQAIVKERTTRLSSEKAQLENVQSKYTDWTKSTERKLKEIREYVDKYEGVNFDEELELHSLCETLTKTKQSLVSDFNDQKRECTRLKSNKLTLENEISQLEKSKCPYCLQHMPNSKEKLVEVKIKHDETAKTIDDYSSSTASLDSKIKSLENDINEASKQMIFDSISKAVSVKQLLVGSENQIHELEIATNPHEDIIQQLRDAIKTIESTLDSKKLTELANLLENEKFLLKLLTDKNSFIRKTILDKAIPFFNHCLHIYTNKLGLPHIVKFNNDMTCSISQYDRELDFGNLSGGESKRVEVALALAFKDVLSALHGKVNCMLIDEIDSSLDAIGVHDVFSTLKNKAIEDGISLFVISHRPEAVNRFNKTLTVTKSSGFSSVSKQ